MLDPRILRLVAITDDADDRRDTLVDRMAAAVRGGATSVQVRLKTAPPREVVEITRAIMIRTSVPVIVNDRAAIALAAARPAFTWAKRICLLPPSGDSLPRISSSAHRSAAMESWRMRRALTTSGSGPY